MIAEHIKRVEENILKACIKSGRDPREVTLIAVSKTKPVEMIGQVYDNGIREFGENKVQEILMKQPLLPKDINWHMIGHLQTNKVKQVLPYASLIHSVDSVKLAACIDREAKKAGLTASVLLEVNVARETSKYGFYLEELEEALEIVKDFSGIQVKGFMTIAPFVTNSEENREIFRKLHQFYVDIKAKNIDNVNMSVLSMGMTGDYSVAIEEGATMIRVGTGIFGAR